MSERSAIAEPAMTTGGGEGLDRERPPAAPAGGSSHPLAWFADLVSLTKPRITGLVLVTTSGGLWLASAHQPSIGRTRALLVVLGTALVVSAASTLNCYLERDVDRLMERTQERPLPAGRLSPAIALALGLGLACFSLPLLATVANRLTALLAAIALGSYVLIYTPLKLRSPKALVVGAVPGAIPPLMGWTAVTGRLDLSGLVLFAILFLWQMPHFLAIALYRKEDYARAGVRIVPIVRGERNARLQLVAWALLLVPVTLLLTPLHVTGVGYLVVAAVLGASFLVFSLYGLRRDAGKRWARSLFLGSIAYLTLLFAALALSAV